MLLVIALAYTRNKLKHQVFAISSWQNFILDIIDYERTQNKRVEEFVKQFRTLE